MSSLSDASDVADCELSAGPDAPTAVCDWEPVPFLGLYEWVNPKGEHACPILPVLIEGGQDTLRAL
jgi:hypothetical protein